MDVRAFDNCMDLKDINDNDTDYVDRVQEMALTVYETLGPGHSESVYHRAMEVMLRLNKMNYESERIVPIEFKGHIIGNFRLDLVVNGIIIELKSVMRLKDQEEMQARNYLKTTGYKTAVLINFGPSLEVKRVS
jgi:GxxExxY protein